MGLLELGGKVIQEIGNVHGRAFFEAVNPPYDVYKKGDDVFIDVDLPGYDIKQIKYRVHGGPKILGTHLRAAVLTIEASRKEIDRSKFDVLVSNRPVNIQSTIFLPGVKITEDEVSVSWAKYLVNPRGVLRLCLRLPTHTDHPSIVDGDSDSDKHDVDPEPLE